MERNGFAADEHKRANCIETVTYLAKQKCVGTDSDGLVLSPCRAEYERPVGCRSSIRLLQLQQVPRLENASNRVQHARARQRFLRTQGSVGIEREITVRD